MPRLDSVPFAQLPKDIMDRLAPLFPAEGDGSKGTLTGTPGNWWTIWGRVPGILRAFIAFDYRTSPIDPKIRELALVRTGYARASQFVYSQHCKAARKVGLEEEKIRDAAFWTISDVYSPKDRAVLAFVDGQILEGGRVHDRVMAAMKANFSAEEILVLSYLVNMYNLHAITTKALRMEYDDVPERIVEIPAPETQKVQDWQDPAWAKTQG